MEYFIPEWDDRVDLTFDFLHDKFSENRNPYDDVYAHQIYEKPNYDGILVSRTVIDKSQRKKKYIEDAGNIHNFIKFSGKIMGDSGAFGYIKEEVPPYTTDEVLNYYHNLGFNYGVSVDHLIVGPFAEPGIREKRYDLTLKNAQDFLDKHQARGYSFTPIGVAQGWNPDIYADAVKELIIMGYDYIALGGIARAQTKVIIEILQAVQPHLKSNIKLHLFGVGRIDATLAFNQLGVTSFDSSSPLRSAWLDSTANYHTLSGKTYAAVRIPPVDKSGIRVKRVLEAGIADQTTIKKLEQNSLKAMRDFDSGKLGLEETLEKLIDYDQLLELPRHGQINSQAKAKRIEKHTRMYRELLSDRPWKECECKICQEIGIEVVIFRGNDRNRRRGFHNTYVFYQRFEDLLKRQSTKVDEEKSNNAP